MHNIHINTNIDTEIEAIIIPTLVPEVYLLFASSSSSDEILDGLYPDVLKLEFEWVTETVGDIVCLIIGDIVGTSFPNT